jgi:hypothetical protein
MDFYQLHQATGKTTLGKSHRDAPRGVARQCWLLQ